MKKLIFITALFLASPIFAEQASVVDATPTEAPQQKGDKHPPIVISDDVKLISKTEHEENKDQYYSIDYSYPELQGDNLSANEKQFNQFISNLAQQQVNQFKNYLAVDKAHMQTLPDEVKHNSLSIDYDADVMKPEKNVIISVRLKIEGMQAGRAHPYHAFQVVNFDMTAGHVLALNKLFKPHRNYLKVLAKFSEKKLNEKLQDKWMIADGTKPDPKNYKNWNLQPNGLLITFDEYQVAPYVYGSPEVKIPYSELKAILSPKSPIYPCAEKPNLCASVSNAAEKTEQEKS